MTVAHDPIALQGATIAVGEGLELAEDAHLVVEDGKIAALGAGPAPVGCAVVDVSGCLILPAFVNAHTHLADSSLKELGFGLPEWELLMPPDGLKHRMLRSLDRDRLVAGMRASLREMLRTGTVAFSDFREQGLPGVQALDEALAGLPITAVTMARFAELPPHSDEDFKLNVLLPDGYMEELDSLLAAAPGFSFVTANDTTDAGLRQAAEAVREGGRRLAVHVAENEGYRDLSLARTGVSDVARAIEHLQPDFVVHMTTADAEELDLVADAGIPVVVCGRIQALLGNGLPPLAEFRRRSIPVAFATDNVMLSSPNILDELKYMSRAPRALSRDLSGPSPHELLAGVTSIAARALGLEEEFGSLAPGKSASFVVFDLRTDNLDPTHDPLASIVTRADADDIVAVVHRGEVVAGTLPETG